MGTDVRFGRFNDCVLLSHIPGGEWVRMCGETTLKTLNHQLRTTVESLKLYKGVLSALYDSDKVPCITEAGSLHCSRFMRMKCMPCNFISR